MTIKKVRSIEEKEKFGKENRKAAIRRAERELEKNIETYKKFTEKMEENIKNFKKELEALKKEHAKSIDKTSKM